MPHGHRLSPGGRVGLVDVPPILQAIGEGAGVGHRIYCQQAERALLRMWQVVGEDGVKL